MVWYWILVNKNGRTVAAHFEKKNKHVEKKSKCVKIGTKSLYFENKIRVRYDYEWTPSFSLLMQNRYVSLHKVAYYIMNHFI